MFDIWDVAIGRVEPSRSRCMDASDLGSRRGNDGPPALACASLIILFSFIRRHDWHEKLEIGVFRKTVLPGLVGYGVSHRGAEWLRAPASDEQPHGPSPLHGSMSDWPLTLSTFLLPFVYHRLDGLEYRLLMESCTMKHKHCTSICAVQMTNLTGTLRDRHGSQGYLRFRGT